VICIFCSAQQPPQQGANDADDSEMAAERANQLRQLEAVFLGAGVGGEEGDGEDGAVGDHPAAARGRAASEGGSKVSVGAFL
jgi:hypothetical protein